MRISSWNIRHGGGNHRNLGAALLTHDPDVIVLCEHRVQRTAPLIDHLRFFGWPHIAASATNGEDNGVAIVSRIPLEVRSSPLGEAPFSAWGVEVIASGMTIIGVYAPLQASLGSSQQIQREFWNRILRLAERRQHEPVMLIGDFNTGALGVDGPNALPCSDAFQRLSTLGWEDAWRACNPKGDDFSYVQRFNGGSSNWRIDHVFVSPVLAGGVRACRYSHTEREAGLSDHSILLIEGDVAPKTDS